MNTRESIAASIKQLVLLGGQVNLPYKRTMRDHMGEVKLFQCKLYPQEPMINGVHWPYGTDRFDTLDEAIEFAMKTVFTRKNLALAFNGIRKRVMTEKDLDDLTEDELKELVKKYNDEFFEVDFPFTKKKKSK